MTTLRLSGRQRFAFAGLCCLVYFMSYLTRMNYSACLAELSVSLGVSRSLVSLPVTGCFITYGAGQLLCGFLGDRFCPRKMIFTGLSGACVCNFLVSLFPYVEVIIPVWCLNGFFQSMLWPPLVRIMAETLEAEDYQKCCVQVNMASSLGTVFVYLLVPLCIRFSGWRTAFLLPAAAGAAAAVLWSVGIRRLQEKDSRRKENTQTRGIEGGDGRKTEAGSVKSLCGLLLGSGLLPVIPAIVLHGILRDGITTWMPVYVMESFGLSSSVSVLTAVVLPVFSMISIQLASQLLRKMKNETAAAALLFGVAAAASFALVILERTGPAVSVGLMTLTAGCMYGTNLFLISRAPAHFARFGKASTISGILNASTYVGSALSAWLFGEISGKMGWSAVIVCWVGISLGGMLLCLACAKKWGRFVSSPA